MQITVEQLAEYQKNFTGDPMNRLAMNAATRVEIQELAINRQVLESIDFCCSHELATAPEATAQKKLGICWMYAGFNMCRESAQRQMNVETVEFSGPYLVFWDKFEKCNYFLHKMVEFIERPLDDRLVWMLLQKPLSDEGWWHAFANLTMKYGLVPKSLMQDTKYTEDSTRINALLCQKLRQYTASLRESHRLGHSREQLWEQCRQDMDEIYRILAIALGLPPARFSWNYRDRDKNFHRIENVTPQEFFQVSVGVPILEMYSLWNSPLPDTPYYRSFTIPHVENMVGGRSLLSVNLPIAELKKLALAILQEGEVCLFSCEVGQESLRKEGVLYKGLYDYSLVFRAPFNAMDKATRLAYGESHLTHSMVLTGVDIVEGKPVKWKVENSWGAEHGQKGYFIMSDDWFEDHVYEVVVPRRYLPQEVLKIFDQTPIELPYWHPML